MPSIPIVEPDQASPSVKTTYEDFKARMAFPAPPNFIKVQGHSQNVVQGTWDLVRGVLVTGAISRYTKEMLFVAISSDRGCVYCTAAHIACCRMFGADEKLLSSLVRNIPGIPDPKIRDIILFGLKCSRSPQRLTAADFETLQRHGLGEPDIVEIIAMSALAVYANIMADATGVEADRMFDEI